jgi:hypothetical protein
MNFRDRGLDPEGWRREEKKGKEERRRGSRRHAGERCCWGRKELSESVDFGLGRKGVSRATGCRGDDESEDRSRNFMYNELNNSR